jgi:hypothetical protein
MMNGAQMKKIKPYRPTAAEIELHSRAEEAEKDWLSARGLTMDLNRKSNAKPRARRMSTESPKEAKANICYRRYRQKQLGKLGPASKVRRLNPNIREIT